MPNMNYRDSQKDPQLPKKGKNYGFVYLLGIILFISLFSYLFDSFSKVKPIELTLNDFRHYAIEKKIESAEVHENEVVGLLKVDNSEENREFKVIIFSDQIQEAADILVDNDISTKMVIPNNSAIWGYVLNFGSTILIIVLFWVFISRSMQSNSGGQVFNFGKSTAKMFLDNHPPVTLADVAGLHEVKTEIKEIVDFLQHPENFKKIGAKIPRGILLVGPPGCGKTLIARAISGEAKVPFFTVSGSDFVEMFVGVGASRVRDLFLQAKKFAPAIIFVDEIDAVGRQRGAGLGGGHDEREQTLNQILVEMDGFDPNAGIIIIAATNRPDILDPALLRPGRFDRQLYVDMPDSTERLEILRIHSKNKPLEADINLTIIAKQTSGFTGADLENLLNESAILAARRKKEVINHQDIEDAIDRIIAGPEKKSRKITEKEKWAIAIHETGHAAVLRYFSDLEPIHKISIVSRGRALGYTMQLPLEDRFLHTKTELTHTMAGILGGRAAEEYFLHDISTGAANDLEKVTELATDIVTKYGMSKSMGQRTYGKDHSGAIFLGKSLTTERNYSEETGRGIDIEIKRFIDEAYKSAYAIIEEKHTEINKIANILLEKESISGMDLEDILAGIRPLSQEEKTKNPLFEEYRNSHLEDFTIEKPSEEDSKDESSSEITPLKEDPADIPNDKPDERGKEQDPPMDNPHTTEFLEMKRPTRTGNKPSS